MKSVCILVQNYYEIDIRVRRKAEALVDAGYEVDVLSLQSSFSKARNYSLNGVKVYTLALGKKRGSLARYAFEYALFFLWCAWKLAGPLRARHYAIIDANNLPDFLVFAGLPAKLRGAKIVFDMHEITPEFYMSKYGIGENALLSRLLRWIEKASFGFADHVITINEPIQKLLEGRGLASGKATVIMNSVDDSLFATTGAPGAAEAKPAFVMMYHGTLTKIYGLDIAIEAFAKAQGRMPGAEFWILGNGPERADLERQARDAGLNGRVKFIGNVLPQEVKQWLNRCDAGVLATRRDVFLEYSFSNKLSEYIIMEKAVLVSRLRAIRHYFSENALAFFEPENASELAEKMVEFYRDSELRARFSAAATREYAAISWKVMKQRYLTLIENLAGGKPGESDHTPMDAEAPAADLIDSR